MNTEELNFVVHLVAKFFTLSSFIALIGILLGLAFLVPDNKGYLQSSRLQKLLPPISIAWLVSTVFFLIAEVAFILNTQISEVMNGNILRSFITQTILGKLFGIFPSPRKCSFDTGEITPPAYRCRQYCFCEEALEIMHLLKDSR